MFNFGHANGITLKTQETRKRSVGMVLTVINSVTIMDGHERLEKFCTVMDHLIH